MFRIVKNPSYKHSRELINEFNRLSASIYYKDHSAFEEKEIVFLIKMVNLCKTYGLKAEPTRWIMREVVDLNLTEKLLIEDYIPVLASYQKLKQKLKPLFEYVSIAQLNYAILSLSDDGELVLSHDEFGIIDEHNGWLLTLPETINASRFLGKGTVWCTARNDSGNLFLNYIENGTILFYATNVEIASSKDPRRKISIGYENMQILFFNTEKQGGSTVDADNNGLNESSLIDIFGRETYLRFKKKMDEKVKRMKNIHPLTLRITKAASDVKAFAASDEQIQKRALYREEITVDVFNYAIKRTKILKNHIETNNIIANAKSEQILSFMYEENKDREEYHYGFLYNMKTPISVIFEILQKSNIDNSYYSVSYLGQIFQKRKLPDSFYKYVLDRSNYREEIVSYMLMGLYVPEFVRKLCTSSYKRTLAVTDTEDVDFLSNIFKYINIYTNISNEEKRADFMENIAKNSKTPLKIVKKLIVFNKDLKDVVAHHTKNEEVALYLTLRYINYPGTIGTLAGNMLTPKMIKKLSSYKNRDNFIILMEKDVLNYKIFKRNEEYIGDTNSVKAVEYIMHREKDPFKKFRYYLSIKHVGGKHLLFSREEIRALTSNEEFMNDWMNYHNYDSREIVYHFTSEFTDEYIEGFVIHNFGIAVHSNIFENISGRKELLKKLFHHFLSYQPDNVFSINKRDDGLKNIIKNVEFDKEHLSLIYEHNLIDLFDNIFKITEDAVMSIMKNLRELTKRNKEVNLWKIFSSKSFGIDHLYTIWEDNLSMLDLLYSTYYEDDNMKISKVISIQNSITNKKDTKEFQKQILAILIIAGIIKEEDWDKKFYGSLKNKELLTLANSKSVKDKILAASSKDLTSDIIKILKHSKNKDVLNALLDNPDINLSDLF